MLILRAASLLLLRISRTHGMTASHLNPPPSSSSPLTLPTTTEDPDPRCAFTLSHFKFNLCPLFHSSHPDSSTFYISIVEETPPTRTESIYAMNLGGEIERDRTLPSELQCPPGTSICLTIQNTRPNHPSEPTRILQVVPIASVEGLDVKAKLLVDEKANGQEHAPLQVTMHGGMYMNNKQKASFRFICDQSIDEPSTPSFIYSFNGTHAFEWKSRYACHEPLPISEPPPGEEDDDPAQEPPADPDSDGNKGEDEEQNDDENWDGNGGDHRTVWGIGRIGVILLLFIFLTGLARHSLLKSSPRLRRRRKFWDYKTPTNFSSLLSSWSMPILSWLFLKTPSSNRDGDMTPRSYIFSYTDLEDDGDRDEGRDGEVGHGRQGWGKEEAMLTPTLAAPGAGGGGGRGYGAIGNGT